MAPFDLIERTRLFALDVRANYRAARKSRSHAEFTSKLQSAFEEADESLDWLEYLRDSKIRDEPALLSEARELSSILGAAVNTARRHRNDGRNPPGRTSPF
jgi:four helix bundle protein